MRGQARLAEVGPVECTQALRAHAHLVGRLETDRPGRTTREDRATIGAQKAQRRAGGFSFKPPGATLYLAQAEPTLARQTKAAKGAPGVHEATLTPATSLPELDRPVGQGDPRACAAHEPVEGGPGRRPVRQRPPAGREFRPSNRSDLHSTRPLRARRPPGAHHLEAKQRPIDQASGEAPAQEPGGFG